MENDAERTQPPTADALREENARLRRAVEELSVLNEVATALSHAEDLSAALEALVRRSCRATAAEQGVIVLVDEQSPSGDTPPTLVRSVATQASHEALRPGMSVVGWVQRFRRPLVIADPHADPRFPGAVWPEAVRTVLAAPMLVHGRLIGILTLYNKRAPEGFSDADVRLVGILAAQSAQVVEQMRLDEERARVVRLFGQHTAPSVVEALMGTAGEVEVRRQEVCIMFLDLRGFTQRAEGWPPEQVVAYLNTFFEDAIAIISRHGGIVHQLLGDGFMAYFGVPTPDHAAPRRAVSAALELVARVEEACAEGALEATELGIGLHAGEAVAGPVGSSIHREYKVTGDVVNVTARIEKLNKRFESRLLVSEAVWNRLGEEKPEGEALGTVELEGRSAPIALYRLA